MRELDDITGELVDAALEVHRKLGPGLLESVYETVLAHTLERRGLAVARQVVVQVEYGGLVFAEGFRVDIVVEDRVIAEVKSVARLLPVHTKQILTYLRLMDLRVGFVLNFGGATMREGLKRVVNELCPSASPRLRVNQAPVKDRRTPA
jgi:iron complex transport system substrate-binding protein